MELTPSQRTLLQMYSPSSPTLRLKPCADRDILVADGLVALVPPIWMNYCSFAITAKGQKALEGA